jgi:hypothetical protein
MMLDDLLAGWAEQHRLTELEAARVRNAIVQAESELDQERLWDLLRPVTALLDGPRALHERLTQPYLRLT